MSIAVTALQKGTLRLQLKFRKAEGAENRLYLKPRAYYLEIRYETH